jgi:hypothetical protein
VTALAPAAPVSAAPEDVGAGFPPDVVETHVSVLAFVGDHVYKLKKPVSMGFLDFSTRQARQAACHEEVRLNRRLAPDVYLGVVDLLGPDGEPVDHLVLMRRMPAERRLSALLGHGVDKHLRRIARLVATFHAGAETSPEISSAATRDAVAANWEANFAQMAPFVGPVLDPDTSARVEILVRRYLAGREALFRLRITEGRVRDGHGDLQAEDIFCLEDGPRILDCIEFDERLRHGDVLADVAFLAMDLERLGAAEAAQRFLRYYREFAGESYPASLAHHYVAYRAHVRAKVACLRHAQGDPSAALAATGLLDLTLRHLERGRVALVLVGGLPGTGKSALATAVADARDWSVLRSDEIRKELAGIPRHRPAPAAYGEGLYRPEMTEGTYQVLLERARKTLEAGESVILDASWTDARERAAAAEVATDTASEFFQLQCLAPAELAAARMTARRSAGDASDATPAIAAAMAEAADPWPAAVPVDTSSTLARSLEQALAVLPPTATGGPAGPDRARRTRPRSP